MGGNIFENPVKSSCPEGFMEGNRDNMSLPVHDCRKSLVAAGQVINSVSITAETAGKLVAIDVPGQLHTAISSSLTM